MSLIPELLVSIRDARRNSPLENASVELRIGNRPPFKGLSPSNGTITVPLAATTEPIRITVSCRKHQREIRELTQNEIMAGKAEFRLWRANEAYYAQRILELPGDAVASLAGASKVSEAIRYLGVLGKLVARWKRDKRILLYFVLILATWFYMDIYPGRIDYRNWRDKSSFPGIGDDSESCLDKYPSGRIKYLGPGTVIVSSRIKVESGAELHIRPGTELLFTSDAGIDVEGLLDAAGGFSTEAIFFDEVTRGSGWENISAWKDSSIVLQNCTIRHGRGQAITPNRSVTTQPQPQKSREEDALRGGALFGYGTRVCIIDRCKIEDCTASVGGGIHLRQCTAAITGTQFVGNRTKKNAGGGAITLWHANATFTRCLFKANEAALSFEKDGSSEGNGGAVYLAVGSNASFSECSFERNKAGFKGGAIFANNTYDKDVNEPLKILGSDRIWSVFSQNTAEREGGAIYLEGPTFAIIDQAKFTLNSAAMGGALSLRITEPFVGAAKPSVTVTGNQFSENTGSGVGKDIHLDFTSTLDPQILKGFLESSIMRNNFEDRFFGASKVYVGYDNPGIREILPRNNTYLQSNEVETGKCDIPRNIPYCSVRGPANLNETLAMVLADKDRLDINLALERIRAERNKHPAQVKGLQLAQTVLNALTTSPQPRRKTGTPSQLDGGQTGWTVRRGDHSKAWIDIQRSVRNGDPVVLSTGLSGEEHFILVIGYRITQTFNRFLSVHDASGRLLETPGAPNWHMAEAGSQQVYSFDRLACIEASRDPKGMLISRRHLPDQRLPDWTAFHELPGDTGKDFAISSNDPEKPTLGWEYLMYIYSQ